MSRLYNILNALVGRPYITEMGTIDSWRYTKWSNGRVEAWCRNLSFGSKTANVWVSPIRYVDLTGTIPDGIFDSLPLLTMTSSTNQWWVNNASATSATSFTSRICTLASGSTATSVNVYAVSQ